MVYIYYTRQIMDLKMRFVSFSKKGILGIGIRDANGIRGLLETNAQYPGHLLQLIQKGDVALKNAFNILNTSDYLQENEIELLPPISHPTKVICVGLNYADHTKESPYEHPDYPTLFLRFNSCLLGHQQHMINPLCSDQLDFEG